MISGMIGLVSVASVLVTAPVDRVYAPAGYDTEDEAELVLVGTFPDGCWEKGPASAEIDYQKMTITVDAKAYRPSAPDVECTLRIEPFVQSVPLGRVKAGSYDVFVLDRPDADTEPLVIAEAGPGRIDPIFAPVEAVDVAGSDGAAVLTLDGTYPYTFIGCMVLRDVKVSREAGNLLVVRPYAEYVEGEACLPQSESKHFTARVPLAHLDLEPGDYLAHVKLITGGALNEIVSVGDSE